MLRVCKSCANKVCELFIIQCSKCLHINIDMKQEPCKECIESFGGCNFEPKVKEE